MLPVMVMKLQNDLLTLLAEVVDFITKYTYK